MKNVKVTHLPIFTCSRNGFTWTNIGRSCKFHFLYMFVRNARQMRALASQMISHPIPALVN